MENKAEKNVLEVVEYEGYFVIDGCVKVDGEGVTAEKIRNKIRVIHGYLGDYNMDIYSVAMEFPKKWGAAFMAGGSIAYSVVATDDYEDVIGICITRTDEEYAELMKSGRHVFKTFKNIQNAISEIIKFNQKGAFCVGVIGPHKKHLVFRTNDEYPQDYLTTRADLERVLKVRQYEGIPWKTVDEIVEEYEKDKTVGTNLYKWMTYQSIRLVRSQRVIERIESYTEKTRTSAIAY